VPAGDTSPQRDELPNLDHFPDGQALPSPQGIDFTPGPLLGSVSGELGLRKFLEEDGHELVVTADKDGPECVFDRELPVIVEGGKLAGTGARSYTIREAAKSMAGAKEAPKGPARSAPVMPTTPHPRRRLTARHDRTARADYFYS
jgi:hypothetical protein